MFSELLLEKLTYKHYKVIAKKPASRCIRMCFFIHLLLFDDGTLKIWLAKKLLRWKFKCNKVQWCSFNYVILLHILPMQRFHQLFILSDLPLKSHSAWKHIDSHFLLTSSSKIQLKIVLHLYINLAGVCTISWMLLLTVASQCIYCVPVYITKSKSSQCSLPYFSIFFEYPNWHLLYIIPLQIIHVHKILLMPEIINARNTFSIEPNKNAMGCDRLKVFKSVGWIFWR